MKTSLLISTLFIGMNAHAINTLNISVDENRPGITESGKQISFEAATRREGTKAEFKSDAISLENSLSNKNFYQKGTIETRGQSCLTAAARKCYGIKIEGENKESAQPLAFEGSSQLKDKKFNLVSMWVDQGYISSKIGFDFFKQLGLFDYRTEYAKVMINGKNKGLYLVTEKPKDVAQRTVKSQYADKKSFDKDKLCFERRSYRKLDPDVNDPSYKTIGIQCTNRFNKIAEAIMTLSGQELSNKLHSLMNLKLYMQWLIGNSILTSGDYSDEVYVYMDTSKPDAKMQIMAWDFDDLFKSVPHSSDANNITYANLIKTSLLYSFESPLDVKIAQDPVLKQELAEVARELIPQVDENFIKKLQQGVWSAIADYTVDQNVMAESLLDHNKSGKAYTSEFIKSLLSQRMQLIHNRIVVLKARLSPM